MQTPINLNFLSVEEYLQGEEKSDIKHEYVVGQIFAMTGASRQHNLIAGNIYAFLRDRLRGSGCRTFISDMKVRLQTRQQNADLFYYPDVVVSCDRNDNQKFFLTSPCWIFEILSPSTETIDRREKRLNYQNIDSLQEYILVSQDESRVEIYRKDGDGNWLIKIMQPEENLELDSVNLTLTLANIYEDVF
ncbi:MAG: Uma2 family endonuclease [Xenococcaceae cyanobacterium]